MALAVILIVIGKRAQGVPRVNEVLTEYGDLIRACSSFNVKANYPEFELGGLVHITLIGDEKEIRECHQVLGDLQGVRSYLFFLITAESIAQRCSMLNGRPK